MTSPEEARDTTVTERYAAERAKRLRADGVGQYSELTGSLARLIDDPYMPVLERAPVTDHATCVIIGGGFAGLVVGARLKEAGIQDVRMLDKAGDFGGTWYWNRYPGAQCDSPALVYMPLLEETGYIPSHKYAKGWEIQAHCQRIAKQFDLYDGALFHTQVTSLMWDDAHSRWHIQTNRGDDFTAQFVGAGLGLLHVPKLPGVPGIDDFAGTMFHTSRWDYSYTGGDWNGAPMEKLADKRVAIIGTGATAIQVVPELAKSCKELFVFQRTPSSVGVRNNGPIDPESLPEIATPGWQQRWIENFARWCNDEALTRLAAMADADDDAVFTDGFTEVFRQARVLLQQVPPEQRSPEKVRDTWIAADTQMMNELRALVDSVVDDAETAEQLKPWYKYFCKRPTFSDDYLQAFNRPNTHLVDTNGKGVERVTANAVVANGVEYPVDCIVYSSGFFLGTDFGKFAGFDPIGRDGKKLSEYWSDGYPTLHGVHVDGFPNFFYIQTIGGATQRASITNNFVQAGKSVAAVVKRVVAGGFSRVEPTTEAVNAWSDVLLPFNLAANDDGCTPSYLNNEGQGVTLKVGVAYPKGSVAFFEYLDEWRSTGEYDGLVFS
jgi:cation diffusion facilitator CzcD-associated flavoprotein CzcO